MRMWMVDPKVMCQKHLCGEHAELHMFVGTIKKRISVTGYVETGLFDSRYLISRHEALAAEMLARGYNHKSPLPTDFDPEEFPGNIDSENSLQEMARRCMVCAKLQEDQNSILEIA